MEKKNTLLSVAVALALAGCGGSTGTQGTSAGKAVDGYLSGSSVVCDTNNNGVADAGEATVTTNSTGDFAFTPACASTIVVSGGTSIDTGLPFKGVMKAPAGSAVATPLTNLMVNGGLTSAQLVSALGLPVGTDVTQVDPAAKTAGGALVNGDLQKKTLAMQQIIQQITETIGGLAQNSSPAAIKAIYGEVAKAVVTTLTAPSAKQLVDANGNVNSTLVSGIVQQSVKNVAATTDAALATVKASVAVFSPVSVAEVVSVAVAAQAQSLAKASDSALVALATSVQANPAIANAASQLGSMLTTANEAKVDLIAVGTALQQLSDTDTSNDAAGKTSLTDGVAAQAAAGNITAPTVNLDVFSQPVNALAIKDDSVELNGSPYTLKQFKAGVTLPKVGSIDTIGLPFSVNGTPIPRNSSGVMTSRVSLGMELTDTGSSGRVLQFMLDQVDVTLDSNNQLTVSVPAGAKLYAYGKTSSGNTATVTITNVSADQFIASAGTKLTLNADKIMNRITGSSSPSQFANLQNITGTFNLKMVVSNLNIASQNDQTAVKVLSVAVTDSGQPAVNGLGVQGIFTVK